MKNKKIKFLILALLTVTALMLDNTSTLAVTANTAAPLSLKSAVMKFLIAMGAVAISSIALYIGLKIYNGMRGKVLEKKSPVQKSRSEFDTPETVEDAVDFFINHNRL
ncbi:hypothetical protein J6E39_03660 [bacterium]|nr:hypothetical protein [bacterium]